ncbi:MAG TPA: DoxX family membrane protein [Deltaproteobacteria bacterium]|nr:DoxX family membrane protein [Deltaproteobacteria bacterium]
MNNTFEKILQNEWLELTIRWILGTIFVAASYYKIISPENFARAVYSYDLFPGYSINLIAIIFPYMECFTGLCLILGIYHRSAAILINAMLFGFIILLSINIMRGHQFDCGCFSFNGSGNTDSVYSMLIRNVILLLMGGFVLYYKGYRKWSFQKSSR